MSVFPRDDVINGSSRPPDRHAPPGGWLVQQPPLDRHLQIGLDALTQLSSLEARRISIIHPMIFKGEPLQEEHLRGALSIPQFILDTSHPLRPHRGPNRPWLIDVSHNAFHYLPVKLTVLRPRTQRVERTTSRRFVSECSV